MTKQQELNSQNKKIFYLFIAWEKLPKDVKRCVLGMVDVFRRHFCIWLEVKETFTFFEYVNSYN